MKKLVLAATAIVALAACKKGTTITYRVTNNSGEQLTITSYYNYNSQGTSSSVVNSGETRDIMILSKSSGSFESGYAAGQDVDSVTGYSNTGKMLAKDLSKEANWSKSTSKKQHLHTFTTEITAQDLK